MPTEHTTEVSFYIVAHADDWQLFMQPNAYKDLTSGSRVIFIVTTAGDAGADKTYWHAREEGMKSSIRFCLAPGISLIENSSTRNFNGHNIHCCSLNHVTCYFLRLPDGGLDSNGFETYGYQSLGKLKSEKIESINAVDDSASYHSWSDFYNALQSVIQSECAGQSNVWLNHLNPDLNANPNDHPDHIATGQAIQAISISLQLNQALFVGYSINELEHKLGGIDLFWKAGMFAAYEKAVFDQSGYSTLKEGVDIYTRWCLSSARFITVNP